MLIQAEGKEGEEGEEEGEEEGLLLLLLLLLGDDELRLLERQSWTCLRTGSAG